MLTPNLFKFNGDYWITIGSKHDATSDPDKANFKECTGYEVVNVSVFVSELVQSFLET